MVAPNGAIASPAQGVSYFAKDGYHAKDDLAHKEASARAGRGEVARRLEPDREGRTFRQSRRRQAPAPGPPVGRETPRHHLGPGAVLRAHSRPGARQPHTGASQTPPYPPAPTSGLRQGT